MALADLVTLLDEVLTAETIMVPAGDFELAESPGDAVRIAEETDPRS